MDRQHIAPGWVPRAGAPDHSSAPTVQSFRAGPGWQQGKGSQIIHGAGIFTYKTGSFMGFLCR